MGGVHPAAGGNGVNFFAKWLFSPGNKTAPGGAVGVTVSDVAGNHMDDFYVVGSKFITMGNKATENASVHGGMSYLTDTKNTHFVAFGGFDVELVKISSPLSNTTPARLSSKASHTERDIMSRPK